MADEELSRALSTVRAAARAEGHEAEISNNVEVLILFALRHAGREPECAAGVREAVEVVRKWQGEGGARNGCSDGC